MEKIIILALFIISGETLVILVNVIKVLNDMKAAISKNFLELGKRQITISDRIDAVSDVFDRLSEPLDRMDKNVSDMANMTEDTHLKMLYAYNEVSKIKAHGKHAKRCVVPDKNNVTDTDAKNMKVADEEHVSINGEISGESVCEG